MREGNEWVINGTQKWVPATGWDRSGADVLCVLTRTDPDAPPGAGITMLAVEKP